ncbi:MAG TPA: hypothetical protein VMH81_25175 [Bryobacteraceae bacterium]|nr:hypothetical protein [Bryobacteraceae bacterium]
MKYHPISSDMKCPFCGQLNLIYKRPGLSGDVYRCAAELGGCERTIVHRRRKGDTQCGVVAILNYGHFGAWRPCLPAAADCPAISARIEVHDSAR